MTTTSPPAPAGSAKADQAARRDLYRTMTLIRAFEEAIKRRLPGRQGPGLRHRQGTRARRDAPGRRPGAGGGRRVRPPDRRRRGHGHAPPAPPRDRSRRRLASASPPRSSAGRPGSATGRGGHMHLFDPATHFSCSGIIAEGFPPALGLAFAFQRGGADRVAVAVTGEGAANQGAFHESLNLAALWHAAGGIRGRGQRLGHLGAALGLHRGHVQRRPRGRATACRACGSRTTTSRRVYAAAGRAIARARAGRRPER